MRFALAPVANFVHAERPAICRHYRKSCMPEHKAVVKSILFTSFYFMRLLKIVASIEDVAPDRETT